MISTKTKVVRNNSNQGFILLSFFSESFNENRFKTNKNIQEKVTVPYLTFNGLRGHTSFYEKKCVFIMLVFVERFYHDQFINECTRKNLAKIKKSFFWMV